MKKLVQPFEVVLKRYGVPQGYRGEVTLEVPEAPHPSGLEGAEIDKRLLAGVLGGLREIKAYCAAQDAVRVCGGDTVMHVAETVRMHLARGGVSVSVHLVEQGPEWTAVPDPETVASLTEQLADINRQGLRALHAAGLPRDMVDPRPMFVGPDVARELKRQGIEVKQVQRERPEHMDPDALAQRVVDSAACSKCGVTMASLLAAGTGHTHAATCGGDFGAEL